MDQQGKQIKITLIVDVSRFALTIIDPWHHYAYWDRAGLKFDEYLMVFILFWFFTITKVTFRYFTSALLYSSSTGSVCSVGSIQGSILRRNAALVFVLFFYLCGLT